MGSPTDGERSNVHALMQQALDTLKRERVKPMQADRDRTAPAFDAAQKLLQAVSDDFAGSPDAMALGTDGAPENLGRVTEAQRLLVDEAPDTLALLETASRRLQAITDRKP